LPRLAVNQCGNWNSIAAELADRGQRYQRVGLHLPDERLRLVRHIAEIDAVLFGRRLWQQLFHGYGQSRDRDRVMRERPNALMLKRKPAGFALPRDGRCLPKAEHSRSQFPLLCLDPQEGQP
jgi:hypothetical protein